MKMKLDTSVFDDVIAQLREIFKLMPEVAQLFFSTFNSFAELFRVEHCVTAGTLALYRLEPTDSFVDFLSAVGTGSGEWCVIK